MVQYTMAALEAAHLQVGDGGWRCLFQAPILVRQVLVVYNCRNAPLMGLQTKGANKPRQGRFSRRLRETAHRRAQQPRRPLEEAGAVHRKSLHRSNWQKGIASQLNRRNGTPPQRATSYTWKCKPGTRNEGVVT